MQTSALAVVDSGPMTMQVFEAMCQQADALISSGFLPAHIKTAEQAVAIRLMGEELGVPMMQALRKIHVIQGTPCCASELLLAMARRTREMADLVLTDDGKTCRCTITRTGQSPHTTTFSMEDAAAMGLASKDNWKKQPKTMRQWRAISGNLRVTFSDAIGGMYSIEEIAPDVEVDALGNPLDATKIPGQPIQKSRAKSAPKQIDQTPQPASADGTAKPSAAESVPPAPVASKPSAAPASQPPAAPSPSKREAVVRPVERSNKTYQDPEKDAEGKYVKPAKKYAMWNVTENGQPLEASTWETALTDEMNRAMESALDVTVTISTNARGQNRIIAAKAVEPGPAPEAQDDGEAGAA